MTITNCDILQTRMQTSVLDKALTIAPIDANTVQVEMAISSSLGALYSGNVFGLSQQFNISLIGPTRKGQLFSIQMPSS
jgi:hypothetical protein